MPCSVMPLGLYTCCRLFRNALGPVICLIRLWSQSLTSPSREHLSFLYITWSLDIFHIFCLSKLQYSYLCTHPATVPYYQFSVTDRATLNQNQKPVEKDFSLQIESRKNGLVSGKDTEKSDIHEYPVKI